MCSPPTECQGELRPKHKPHPVGSPVLCAAWISEPDLPRLQSCLMTAAQCYWEGGVHKDRMDAADATLLRKAAGWQGGGGWAAGTHPQREAGVEQVGSPSEQRLRGESVSHLGQGKRLLLLGPQ